MLSTANHPVWLNLQLFLNAQHLIWASINKPNNKVTMYIVHNPVKHRRKSTDFSTNILVVFKGVMS